MHAQAAINACLACPALDPCTHPGRADPRVLFAARRWCPREPSGGGPTVWPPPQADAGDLGRLTTVPPRKVWTGHRLVRVVEFLDLPGLLGAEPTDRGTDHVGRPVDRQVRTGCREGRDESEWQQMLCTSRSGESANSR